MTRTRIRLLAAVLLPLLVGCKTPREASDASILVHCVTPDGEPVRGARIVEWLGEYGFPDPNEFCDALQHLDDFAVLANTDRDGWAVVPYRTGATLVAECDTGRGADTPRGDPRRLEIVVWPKQSVDVEVVDEAGLAVQGIPVEASMTWAGGAALSHWSFFAETNARVRATSRVSNSVLAPFPGTRSTTWASRDSRWSSRHSCRASPPSPCLSSPDDTRGSWSSPPPLRCVCVALVRRMANGSSSRAVRTAESGRGRPWSRGSRLLLSWSSASN